jgi:hypothetical protein
MRNAIARTAAQIRTGHWRSAVYLKRIRKMAEDKCWFCQTSARMTRSHVLLHCPNAKLRGARAEAWEGKDPGGVRVLLANPRWERRFAKFLELSGIGRVMANGTDEDGAFAARMDEWVAWETGSPSGRGLIVLSLFCSLFLYYHSFVRGARTPRPAHSALPRAEGPL